MLCIVAFLFNWPTFLEWSPKVSLMGIVEEGVFSV